MDAVPLPTTLEVVRYAPRRRHGGFHAFGAVEYDLTTGEVASEWFGRYFVCPCGEAMVDGDPALYDRADRFICHANCEDMIPADDGIRHRGSRA